MAFTCTSAWRALEENVAEVRQAHLRDLLSDESRCDAFTAEHNGVFLDYSRQRMTIKTKGLLLELAEEASVSSKVHPCCVWVARNVRRATGLRFRPQILRGRIPDRLPPQVAAMFSGRHINSTEDRAVLHVALRASREALFVDDGLNVVPAVWEVLDRIKQFSDRVRCQELLGATGKPLVDVVAIGIGGSFLGPLFVHTALATEPEAVAAAKGRNLHFVANVDPVDLASTLHGLNPETTLVVIVSKTFTTAETMLNARSARAWIVDKLGEDAVAKHMVAVSTNKDLVQRFGIEQDNVFGFWEWVGGRYSVSSAVGVLPLALQYGFPVVERFLEGMRDMDNHFRDAPSDRNLPVLLGLISVWNTSFLGYSTRAILPYQEALSKFAPHIQQLSMESNGKGVAIDGTPLTIDAGEIDFGEPGTNGQHSFYQLIHQGRTIPCDFVGVVKPQQPIHLAGEQVCNHDELMCNFFAQPDALAYGRTPEELEEQGVPQALVPHKTFSGNRPSLSLLLPELSAFTVGQLLACYEHRIAVQGFLWGINSFDQWGVELGKVLATQIRETIKEIRASGGKVMETKAYNRSTARLMDRFLAVPIPEAPKTHRLAPMM